jgi:prepilin-type N-terminal cleavage/methylation domain-containing protein
MKYCALTSQRSRKAFTLIELLAALAIIGILAAIAFGLTRGANERSRQARAESELALLSQYLEQYRAYYGDYPRVTRVASNNTDGSGTIALYNALNGMRPVDKNAGKFSGSGNEPRQRAFIDRSKFRHEFVPPNPSNPETADALLLDPWGSFYRYYYEPDHAQWENPGYVLYSVGPGMTHQQPDNKGFPDYEHADNVDNLYANRK